MSHAPNPEAVYPPIEKGQFAMNRLESYLIEKFGVKEDGKLFPPTEDEAFYADILIVLMQARTGMAMAETIAAGRFASCKHENQYASGVVSPGHRIFTPEEGAAHALKDILDYEKNHKPLV